MIAPSSAQPSTAVLATPGGHRRRWSLPTGFQRARASLSSKLGRVRRVFPDALARGLALFFGAFAMASALGWMLGGSQSQNIWWIDLSALPEWAGGGFEIIVSALLIAWSLGLSGSRATRRITSLGSLALAVMACVNVVAYYMAWGAFAVAPAMPVPLSVAYAVGFAWLGYRVSSDSPVPQSETSWVAIGVVIVTLAIIFPLLQIAFFGTTDYRRPADAAVVLGARVYDDGVLSTALEDRVRTGVDLYKAGLVSRLVMSGGVGANGIDEAVAMRRRALEMGVPAGAVLCDSMGTDTQATVTDTTAMLRGLGVGRVLVVSQFWHLPRVKLAYLSAGWTVSTVPASASDPIWQTPYFVLREVPAFWQYWARTLI